MEELDRVGHHGHALVERGAQRFEHVVVPRLADDAHRRGVGLDQVAQRVVVVDLALDAPGRAERHHRRRREVELGLGALEELVVLRVGARVAALDVVHAEVVELLGDAQLVVDGERDAFELRAVAQRRVEDLDRFRKRHFIRGHVQPIPCSDRPRLGRRAYSCAIAVVIGPGHGIGRSSTEFTALTSAAVPHTNISSAM